MPELTGDATYGLATGPSVVSCRCDEDGSVVGRPPILHLTTFSVRRLSSGDIEENGVRDYLPTVNF